MGFFWLLLGVRDGGERAVKLLDWCVFSLSFQSTIISAAVFLSGGGSRRIFARLNLGS
jgi:hypothetical protein